MLDRDEIIIRRPVLEELEQIYAFFELVLRDTFQANGLAERKELLTDELLDKRECIQQDFDTNGEERFFLLAQYNDKIIGSIEYGKSNDLLNHCTNNELKDLLEIGTVFVHPQYQKQGVSALLYRQLLRVLASKRIEEFTFDSGYQIAQKIWCKRFGEPTYYLKDYWGEGSHHMVWRVKVNAAIDLFALS